MPKVKFIRPTGLEIDVDATDGESVMEIGRRADVPEMIGECGGALSCATCHVYVDAAWWERIPAPEEYELELIEGAADPEPTSRLSCQIIVSDELDGLTIRMPSSQV